MHHDTAILFTMSMCGIVNGPHGHHIEISNPLRKGFPDLVFEGLEEFMLRCCEFCFPVVASCLQRISS